MYTCHFFSFHDCLLSHSAPDQNGGWHIRRAVTPREGVRTVWFAGIMADHLPCKYLFFKLAFLVYCRFSVEQWQNAGPWIEGSCVWNSWSFMLSQLVLPLGKEIITAVWPSSQFSPIPRLCPTPVKCKNEYLVLALEEETAVQAVVFWVIWPRIDKTEPKRMCGLLSSIVVRFRKKISPLME